MGNNGLKLVVDNLENLRIGEKKKLNQVKSKINNKRIQKS
jgi:hypothetical protein